MDRQQELTAKYKPALDAMSQQGIQVTNVSLQGDKLYVQAYAPSDEAKNSVWDRIKAIDNSYSDLTCDIRVGAAPDTSDLHAAPASSIANGLAAAFRSGSTPDFGSMLANLFNNSNGQQRAGVLNQILSTAGPGVLSSVLPASLSGILNSGGSITPQQAEQISPDVVKNIAEHAQKSNPSVVDQVSNFYSQHPALVQAVGAAGLAMIMNHIRKS